MRLGRLVSFGPITRIRSRIQSRLQSQFARGAGKALHVNWPADLRTDVKLLFQVALALLALSTLGGMIDAQNRFTLSSDLLDAHAHAGTLGWLTLGGIAFALLLFGTGTLSRFELHYARVVTVLAVGSVVAYVLALLSGNDDATAVCSALVLLAIVVLFGWLGMRSVQTRLGVAHLAFLLAMLALVFGATVGFLLDVQTLAATPLFPAGSFSSHPIVLDAGYLLLLDLALVERWVLSPPARTPSALLSSVFSPSSATRPVAAASDALPLLGIVQIALPFASAVALGIAILLGAAVLVPLCAALEVATAAILIMRAAPSVRRVRWREATVSRSFAASAVFLVLYLALFVYVLVRVSLGTYASFGIVPLTTTAGIDHILSIGALSNALFGLLNELTRTGRRFWPAADDIVFWGMNAGLLGFVAGLFVHNSVLALVLEGLFSPILGGSILVGIVAYSVRLQRTHVPIEPPLDG